ncbi:putative glycosyltransferase|uniref:Putative glycosyltransferase n=2 Tax=Brenneria salicis TaxID=55214 RepID=A0A366HZY7_9GAMM|nr:putative glycosyltransferase [Brenneria salicis ATCC 15712 = DSM 30166]RBP60141.1 putative glycosyltransferase [Brenneria salicis ATCC 15712 = DSM 30166]
MPQKAKRHRNPRVVFYSHDTMGLGHVRRNMLLTQAVLTLLPAAEILLITGVREAAQFPLPKGTDIVTLPTYLKTPDGNYRPRALGKDIKRLVCLRSDIIHAAMSAFEPDMVVVDNVPRGAMSELDTILPVLAAKGTEMVLGLRDIIDHPDAVQRQWAKLGNMDAIRNYFTQVWVYGDADFYDLTRQYGFDAELTRKVTFMGYLDAAKRLQGITPTSAACPIDAPYALCMLGGGQDGYALAEAFVHARLPAGRTGMLITGSMMPPEEREQLRQWVNQRDDMTMAAFVPEPLELMRRAERIVSMGGYNTVMEILALEKTALIIPRVAPRQEQWIRATKLAERNLVTCLAPEALSPAVIQRWLAQPQNYANPRDILNFKGLEQVAMQVADVFRTKMEA